MPLYNIIYGPPIFAPLLFAASGFLGLLASLLRERNEDDAPSRQARHRGRSTRAAGEPLATARAAGLLPRLQHARASRPSGTRPRARSCSIASTNVPPIRFFTPEEARLLTAVCDRLLPQDDRDDAHRIPIVDADRRAAPRRAARRLPLRGHAARSRGVSGSACRRSTPSRSICTARRFVELRSARAGRAAQARSTTASRPRRTRSGSACRCTAILDAARAGRAPRPTTRIRGPGTRSASAARPIRAATCGWNAASRSRGRWRSSATPGRRRRARCPASYEHGRRTGRASARAGTGRHALSTTPICSAAFAAPPKPGAHRLGPMQRLDAPMRRFRRRRGGRLRASSASAPAGGVLLQRLARAGLPRGRPRGRPVLGHRARLGQRRGGLAQALLERPAHHRRQRTRSRSAPTTAARASAAARSTGRPSRRASIRRTSASTTQDGVGADWPISYEDLKPYYELLEREMPVAGPAYFPWGDPHGYPYGPHPMGGGRRRADPRLHASWHPRQRRRPGGDPLRLARRPAALHLSRLLHPGLQGRREGEHARSPTCPTRSRNGAEIRDRLHGRRGSTSARTAASPASPTSIRDGQRAVAEGAGGDRLRLRHRDAAPAAQLRLPRLRERPGQLERHASART